MDSDKLVRAYQDSLKKNGASPQAVQWADRDSQYARFSILSEISPDLGSVLDVGCGLADFHHYAQEKNMKISYHGVDIVPEFIELANSALQDVPDAKVSLIGADEDLPGGCDYAILSGVFNNKMSNNKDFMENTLRRMWDVAAKGIAFNAMSKHVDYFDDALYYVDPTEIFAFCKTELGGHPVLRHDYVLRPGGYPFEFAMYVYKEPSAVKT